MKAKNDETVGSKNSKRTKKSLPERVGIEALVKEATREELEALIISCADSDPDFRAEALSYLGIPIGQELEDIKSIVQELIKRYTTQKYITSTNCRKLCAELDMIYKKVGRRIERGEFSAAAAVGEYLLTECLIIQSKTEVDSPELEELTNKTLDTIKEALAEANEIAGEDERREIYEELVRTAKQKQYEKRKLIQRELFKAAAVFCNKKQTAKLYSAIDTIINNDEKTPYSKCDEQDCALRFAITMRIDGEAAARKYLEDNLNICDIREIAINFDMSKEDYQSAEKLCNDGLALMIKEKNVNIYNQNLFGYGSYLNAFYRNRWNDHLYEIYCKTNQSDKRDELAFKLLMGGDIRYFTIIKELYTARGTWENDYPAIKKMLAKTLPINSYMKALALENDTATLISVLEEHNDMLFDYIELLLPLYPERVKAVVENYISSIAEQTYITNGYRHTANMLVKLSIKGCRELAQALVNKLKEQYPNRTAFIRELNRAAETIKKGGDDMADEND